MARQNFGFEKRQREMEKKKKKEQKLQRKLERKQPADSQTPPSGDSDGEE